MSDRAIIVTFDDGVPEAPYVVRVGNALEAGGVRGGAIPPEGGGYIMDPYTRNGGNMIVGTWGTASSPGLENSICAIIALEPEGGRDKYVGRLRVLIGLPCDHREPEGINGSRYDHKRDGWPTRCLVCGATGVHGTMMRADGTDVRWDT